MLPWECHTLLHLSQCISTSSSCHLSFSFKWYVCHATFLPLPWPHWCWMETWLCSPAHPSVVDTAYHQTPEKIHSLMWTQEFCKCVSTEQISLLLRANYNLLNVDVNCYRVPSGNGSHLVNCCDLVRHDSTADWQRRRGRRQTLAKRTFIEWSISHGMGIEQTK